MNACGQSPWPADGLTPQVDAEACQWVGDLPACPRCGSLARPNLLMFGDGEWQEAQFDQQGQRLQRWLDSLHRPMVVEMGAGTAIPSVRHFSERVICNHGGRLVRINPRESTVPTPWDVGLACGSLQALSAIEGVVEFL
jgi:NAD-dependent SIR2 family protein deacetylase